MKKLLFTVGTFVLISASVSAQSTVDSIAAKYKLLPMPAQRTVEQTFPVIGTYQLTDATGITTDATGTTTGNLTITLDPENKGIIWVEGLPHGRIKAYLKKSPSTYRIVSQTTESGKEIKEGTLYFDPNSNVVSIAIGKAYDEADPTAVFALNTMSTTSANSAMGTTSGVNTNTDVNASNTSNASINANNGATGQNETKVKTSDGTKIKKEGEDNGTVKVKTKTGTSKDKSKVTFYTATKIGQDKTDTNTMQSQQQQQQAPQQQQQQQ
ncbi:MAG: hypothetical protein M3342_07225 [Bacteroidota bacterium]|nr:hypothetical protein [Bacteroidota bacterium]